MNQFKTWAILLAIVAGIAGPIAIPAYLSINAVKKYPVTTERIFITEPKVKDDVVTNENVDSGDRSSDPSDQRLPTAPQVTIYVIGEPASIARKRVRELDAKFLRANPVQIEGTPTVEEKSFWDQFKKPSTNKSTEK